MSGRVSMLRPIAGLMLVASALGLTGCGEDNGIAVPDSFTVQIQSDARFDGDIERVSANEFVVTQGMSSTVQNVIVGIDPVGGSEFRAFLDFPLGGPFGVPGDA